MSPRSDWDRFRSEPRRPAPPGGRRAPATAGRGSRGFASTWWGTAWIEALEQRARLDPNRLPRGRTYARQGYVQHIALEHGRISAAVAGSRATPYVVSIRVRTFGEAEWDRVFDAIASRAAHAAALLDGDLEPGIVDDARDAGVELLPDAGDLQPRCSCPDWADPCKHAAAVCYLVAGELDADPFALFALRGRSREEVLAAVRRRRASARGAADSSLATAASAPLDSWEDDEGVVARDAWARPPGGELPPLAAARPRAGAPAPWPVDPPTDAGFTADGLRALAADAAQRAWKMTRGDAGSGLDLDDREDCARRAAAALHTDRWGALVARSGRSSAELVREALAWVHGGAAGVAVLDEDPWTPDPSVMAPVRDALLDAGAPNRSVRVGLNRVTVAPWRAQIRLGRDGLWWGFTKNGNRWEPATGGAEDPDDIIEALLAR